MIIYNSEDRSFEIWDCEDGDGPPIPTYKIASYPTKEEAWAVERAMFDAPPLERMN